MVVEPEVLGGQAGTSSLICNYLSFRHGVSGEELWPTAPAKRLGSSVFAAGDLRSRSLKRVAAAVGAVSEGATSVRLIHA
jgi:hypothetical protein